MTSGTSSDAFGRLETSDVSQDVIGRLQTPGMSLDVSGPSPDIGRVSRRVRASRDIGRVSRRVRASRDIERVSRRVRASRDIGRVSRRDKGVSGHRTCLKTCQTSLGTPGVSSDTIGMSPIVMRLRHEGVSRDIGVSRHPLVLGNGGPPPLTTMEGSGGVETQADEGSK